MITLQWSDKDRDGIFLVKSEHDDPNTAFSDFGLALQAVNPTAADSVLDRVEALLNRQPGALATAVANAAPLTGGGAPAPTASAAPGAPTCEHGPMRYFEAGTSSKTGKPYSASWRCSVPRSACKAKWID